MVLTFLNLNVYSFVTFLKKLLEDISPFYWATDTPVLDFW